MVSSSCAKCTHDISHHEAVIPLNEKELKKLRRLEKKLSKGWSGVKAMEEWLLMQDLQKRDPESTRCRWHSTTISAPEDDNGNPIEEWIFTTTERECGCLSFKELELEPEPVPQRDLQ